MWPVYLRNNGLSNGKDKIETKCSAFGTKDGFFMFYDDNVTKYIIPENNILYCEFIKEGK